MRPTTVTVEFAPETKDVCDFVVKALKTVKSKQPLATLLPEVIKAVDGVANIPHEAKTNLWAFVTTLALFGVDLAKELVTSDVQQLPTKA